MSMAEKQQKKKMGRPTKYRVGHNDAVVSAAIAGSSVTDAEIAELFGVNEQTVKNWYEKYPDFIASVKKAKAISDDKVERSLFERATGYSVPDVHISQFEGTAVVTPIIKHYAPDVTACIFWLKNRRPGQWRDKQDIEHSGNLNVTVIDYKDAQSTGFNPDGSKRDNHAAV
jgi:hypothetical protein